MALMAAATHATHPELHGTQHRQEGLAHNKGHHQVCEGVDGCKHTAQRWHRQRTAVREDRMVWVQRWLGFHA
jgi:hypothetical protein